MAIIKLLIRSDNRPVDKLLQVSPQLAVDLVLQFYWLLRGQADADGSGQEHRGRDKAPHLPQQGVYRPRRQENVSSPTQRERMRMFL